MFTSSKSLSSSYERIVNWSRVEDKYCESNNNDKKRNKTNNPSIVLASYHKGPNKAKFDLTNVLKCPVFPEESSNWTLFSNPQVLLRDQIMSIMKAKRSEKNDQVDNQDFGAPRSDQVDGDEWMDCEGSGETNGRIESQHDLDNLLSRFQFFLNQTSDVEGVASNNVHGSNCPKHDCVAKVFIRPRIFLNILDSVLQGRELNFPRVDPFFYQEDYDLLQEDSDVDIDDVGKSEELPEMNDLMNAMDNELETRAASKKSDGSLRASEAADDNRGGQSIDEIASAGGDAYVLSNLLQSLDASGGGSGPVVNILREMEGT